MAIYAIGDIQGCYQALKNLLTEIQFDSQRDVLWCTGDLVNRGPASLEVLRFFKSLGEPHQVVLGNHDLHLIAVTYGVRSLHHTDTLQSVLAAPDCHELIDWLCYQPLLVEQPSLGYVMTHAGLAPSWDLATAKSLAHEIEEKLRGPLRQSTLSHLFGNTPDYWDDHFTGDERIRAAINYFTRMRFCYEDGRLNFSYKGTLNKKPSELIPWFEVPHRKNANLKIIFGHWAALGGQTNVPNIFPLDTGCVWGNCLTAMRLEDGKKFSVKCDKER